MTHWLVDALLAVMFAAFFVILAWQAFYPDQDHE